MIAREHREPRPAYSPEVLYSAGHPTEAGACVLRASADAPSRSRLGALDGTTPMLATRQDRLLVLLLHLAFARRSAVEIANWQRLTGRHFGCETVTRGVAPKASGQAIRTSGLELPMEITVTGDPKPNRSLSSTQPRAAPNSGRGSKHKHLRTRGSGGIASARPRGERVIGNGQDQDVFTLLPPMQVSDELLTPLGSRDAEAQREAPGSLSCIARAEQQQNKQGTSANRI